MRNMRTWISAGLALMLCLPTACDKQRAGHRPDEDSEDSEALQVARITEDGAAPAAPTEVLAMTPCEKAIQNIRDRDFEEWHGLPSGCDWTPLTGPLPTDWQDVPGRPLGSSFRDAKMIMLSLEGYSRPSLSFVEGQAVLFEAMGPELATEVATLRAALGEPAARLDWDFGTLPCAKSEFVYPERGITLFLSTDHERLFHVGLYAATTLADYEANVRPRLGKSRLPRK